MPVPRSCSPFSSTIPTIQLLLLPGRNLMIHQPSGCSGRGPFRRLSNFCSRFTRPNWPPTSSTILEMHSTVPPRSSFCPQLEFGECRSFAIQNDPCGEFAKMTFWPHLCEELDLSGSTARRCLLRDQRYRNQ